MSQLFSLEGDQPIDDACQLLQDSSFWPFDPSRDRPLLRELHETYPELNLLGEVKKFVEWCDGRDLGTRVRWRARLRRWFANGRRYRANARGAGKGDGRSRPATAAEHAPTGSVEW